MKKDLLYILLIFCAVTILYNGLIFHPGDQLYPARDWYTQHKYWKEFSNHSYINDGEIPLWNPYIFSGSPFLGHPSASTYFYPLNILFLNFNPDSVFKFYLFFHTLFAGISMFYLIKLLLKDRMISLYGAIAFIYGGAWIAKISYGQMTNMVVVSYVPLLFLILQLIWTNPKKLYFLLMGLVWGLQFNAGNIHLFYVCALSLGFFVLFLAIEELINLKKILGIIKKLSYLLIAVIIAAGLGAGQLLPSLETAAASIRTQSDYYYCTSMSLPIWYLPSFILTNFLGSPMDSSYIGPENYTELYGYAGLFTFLFAVVFLLGRKEKAGYRWFYLMIISLLLSFGKFTPLYYLFYKIVPGMNLFRIPATFLFIYIFGLIILSCFGLKNFLDREENKKLENRIDWFIRIFGICLLLLFIIKPFDYVIKSINPSLYSVQTAKHFLESCLHCAIFFAIFVAIYYLKIKRLLSIALITSFLAVDLLIAAFPLLKASPLDKNESLPWLENMARDKSFFRVYDIKSIPQHLALKFGLQKITGVDPLIMKPYFIFTNALIGREGIKAVEQLPIIRAKPEDIIHPEILDLLNVKYLLTQKPMMSFNERYSLSAKFKDKDGEDVLLYENKKVMPRVWLVFNVEILKNLDDFFERLPQLDFKKTALITPGTFDKVVHNKISEGYYSGERRVGDTVKIVKYQPNKIKVKVLTKKPAFLVFSETWMPGWRAKINGKGAPLFRTNYVLRGVPVEKGHNDVEIYYFPPSLTPGALITFTLFGLLIFLIISETVKTISAKLRTYSKKVLLSKYKTQNSKL